MDINSTTESPPALHVVLAMRSDMSGHRHIHRINYSLVSLGQGQTVNTEAEAEVYLRNFDVIQLWNQFRPRSQPFIIT